MIFQFQTDIAARFKGGGKTSRQIARTENCSHNTVLRALRRRGIKTYKRKWTKDAKKRLRNLYPTASTEDLLKAFPNKSIGAILGMASFLKLRKRAVKKACKHCGEYFVSKKKHNCVLCVKCGKRRATRNGRAGAIKRQRRWLAKNPEYLKSYTQRSEVKERIKRYQNKRRKEDPKFHLDQNMTIAINQALKGKKRGRRWEKLVGYTVEDLMEHLEVRFSREMSWQNYGKYWQIDHIRPKSLFRYATPENEEFKTCWSLQNLQPLERIANLKKGNKYSAV